MPHATVLIVCLILFLPKAFSAYSMIAGNLVELVPPRDIR
jgi:hypothetical protein